MVRALTAVLLAGLLGGCTTTTISFSNGQLNGASEPFPSNYLHGAAVAVAGLPIAPSQRLAVSYPQLTFGVTAIDPKRWYACVEGLAPQPGAPDTQPILVYDRFGTATLIRTSIDEPCRNADRYQNPKPA